MSAPLLGPLDRITDLLGRLPAAYAAAGDVPGEQAAIADRDTIRRMRAPPDADLVAMFMLAPSGRGRTAPAGGSLDGTIAPDARVVGDTASEPVPADRSEGNPASAGPFETLRAARRILAAHAPGLATAAPELAREVAVLLDETEPLARFV